MIIYFWIWFVCILSIQNNKEKAIKLSKYYSYYYGPDTLIYVIHFMSPSEYFNLNEKLAYRISGKIVVRGDWLGALVSDLMPRSTCVQSLQEPTLLTVGTQQQE